MGGSCRQRGSVLLRAGPGKSGNRGRIGNRGRSKKGQGVRTWAGDRQRLGRGRRRGAGIGTRMGQGKVSSRGMSRREIGSIWGQGQRWCTDRAKKRWTGAGI